MKYMILVYGALGATLAHAGEGVSNLECKSPSGKTTVTAYAAEGGDRGMEVTLTGLDGRGQVKESYINGIGSADAALNHQTDPKKKVGPIAVIDRPQTVAYVAMMLDASGFDNSPFTLVSEGPVTSKKGPYGEDTRVFKGVLTGSDPRAADGRDLTPIEMSCTYTFSI